jgi:hypothetical protein
MIIWLLALFALGVAGAAGRYAGAIRASASFLGLLVAAFLAMPLSAVLRPLLGLAGVRHPLTQQLLAPSIVFLVILIGAKILGAMAHGKIELFLKYKRGDDEWSAWDRLNQKLGLSVGLLNGAVYFLLLLVPIYVAGYLTIQLGADQPSAFLRLLGEARKQLRSTRMDRVLGAMDPAPAGFYDAADIVGLVYRNPLLQSRLAHYPSFLALGERPEFQQLATDVEINNLIQSQASIADILKHPKVQAIVTNADITSELSRLLTNDLKDLRQFLETGHSPKYEEEKILGLWVFDPNATLAEEKKRHPQLSGFEINRMRRNLLSAWQGLLLVATPDNRTTLKRAAPDGSTRIVGRGSWKREGDEYQVALTDNGKTETAAVQIDSLDKLIFSKGGIVMVFDHQR